MQIVISKNQNLDAANDSSLTKTALIRMGLGVSWETEDAFILVPNNPEISRIYLGYIDVQFEELDENGEKPKETSGFVKGQKLRLLADITRSDGYHDDLTTDEDGEPMPRKGEIVTFEADEYQFFDDGEVWREIFIDSGKYVWLVNREDVEAVEEVETVTI